MTMASSKDGRVRMMSITRMMTMPVAPPMKPATSPSIVPTRIDTATTATPIDSDSRAPWIRRERMSAADRVGAERVGERPALLPERGLEEGRVVGEVRRMRRDHVGKDRHQEHRDDDRQPDHRALVGAKARPELGERVRRAGRGRRGGGGVEKLGAHQRACRMRGLTRP